MEPWNMKLPASLKKRIEEKAAKDKRSTANMARILLERGLESKK